jgi:hypothetical protein
MKAIGDLLISQSLIHRKATAGCGGLFLFYREDAKAQREFLSVLASLREEFDKLHTKAQSRKGVYSWRLRVFAV